MKPKHKFLDLAVGESYVVTSPPRWLKSGAYIYAARSGKSFSVCKVKPRSGDPALRIGRTA